MTIGCLLSQMNFAFSYTRFSRSGQSLTTPAPAPVLSRCIPASAGQRCLCRMLSTRLYAVSPSCTPDASVLKQMRVSVRTSPDLGGALHCLTVNPTDTVDSLKSAIILRSSLPMADYLIELGEKLLDDERDLNSCGITDGAVLSLFKGESYLIEVQIAKPQSLILRADVTETVGSLKAKIKEELAILGTIMNTVNLYYGRHGLDDDTSRFLGYDIPSLSGYKIPKQPRKRITLLLGGDCCSYDDDDDQEWDSREIQPDTVVSSLARFSTRTCIIVFVEALRPGKRIPLNVTPNDTINDLLTMSGHPCSGMNLLIGNKKKKLLLNHDGGGGSCTLEECGIKDQDLIVIVKAGSFIIHFLIPGQETVWMDEPTTSPEHFTKYVECLDTIGMVKSKIQDATGIRPEFQRLKYNGWWMDDDTNSLADYGIFDPEARASYYVFVFPLLSPFTEDN